MNFQKTGSFFLILSNFKFQKNQKLKKTKLKFRYIKENIYFCNTQKETN